MFWMNQVQMVQCCKKVVSVRKVDGATRPLVNARGLHLECVRVVHDNGRACSFVW